MKFGNNKIRNDQVHKIKCIVQQEVVMFKKGLMISILTVVVVMMMTACSALPVASLNVAALSNLTGSQSSTSAALQSNLGVGILKLNGTDQAITSSQASDLLPLWKAIKSLSTDSNTTSTELEALYTQIESSLTTDQKTAIAELKVTSADIETLKEENGLNVITSTKDLTSTSTTSSSGGGAMGGGPGGGGDMGGGSDMAGGDMTGGDTTGAQTASSTSSSTNAKSAASSVTNLNLEFADAIIALLQKTISA
jgi:hypothetical protein